jgi:hypothetical protein
MFSENDKSATPKRPNKHAFTTVHIPEAVFSMPFLAFSGQILHTDRRIRDQNSKCLVVSEYAPPHKSGGAYEDTSKMDKNNLIFQIIVLP